MCQREHPLSAPKRVTGGNIWARVLTVRQAHHLYRWDNLGEDTDLERQWFQSAGVHLAPHLRHFDGVVVTKVGQLPHLSIFRLQRLLKLKMTGQKIQLLRRKRQKLLCLDVEHPKTLFYET